MTPPIEHRTASPMVAATATPISDHARRWICQLTFLLFCALPTAFTVWTIAHRPGPDWWEQSILATCGLSTSIDSVETPLPGQTLLRGVHIHRPVNSGEQPLKLALVELRSGEIQRVEIHDSVSLSNFELYRLVRQLREHLIGLDLVKDDWELSLSKLTLTNDHIDGASLTLSPVTLIATHSPQRVRWDLIGERPETLDSLGVSIQVPSPGDSQPTRIGLRSDRSPLPCWLLTPWLPDADRLGPEANFQGQAQMVIPPTGTVDISARGRLVHVDFSELAKPNGNAWRGTGDIDLAYAITNQGKLQRLRGTVTSHNGVLHHDLIAAATTYLDMVPLAKTTSDWVPYGQLAFQFDINRDQLAIAGAHHNGILFDRNGVPLLDCAYRPNDEAVPQSIVDLARFWATSCEPNAGNRDAPYVASPAELNRTVVDFLKRFDLPPQRQAQVDSRTY